MMRVMITLQEDERRALITLSEQEKRDLRQQAVLIIRHDLQRRGLLPEQADLPSLGVCDDRQQ